MLTQEKLKSLIHYNPDTGVFTWLKYRRGIRSDYVAGSIDANGYRNIFINYKLYRAPRLVWLYMEGYFPECDVDHINRVKDDDRWENLRHVSRQCNTRNCSMLKNNTSGITGVHWSKAAKKWVASIIVSAKTYYLGSFDTKIEAAHARWEAEKLYGFPNCNTTSSAYQYIQNTKQRRHQDEKPDTMDICRT